MPHDSIGVKHSVSGLVSFASGSANMCWLKVRPPRCACQRSAGNPTLPPAYAPALYALTSSVPYTAALRRHVVLSTFTSDGSSCSCVWLHGAGSRNSEAQVRKETRRPRPPHSFLYTLYPVSRAARSSLSMLWRPCSDFFALHALASMLWFLLGM